MSVMAAEPTYSDETRAIIDDSAIETPALGQQELLVERVLSGDREAFGEIVQQYSTLMLRTAYMIVRDHDLAEDAVQDALIQAWQHLAHLRSADALRPWLMRIVVNQCISFTRRLARSNTFVRQSMQEHETNAIVAEAEQLNGKIEGEWDLARAISELPSKQREVIALHYYHGMTLPEIAQAMQTSQNTLKKRTQAALANLRRLLNIDGETKAFESVA
ncbi:MAG TPA: RNA polymerase sigma factor [Ktedonobacteraceae bacterium]|nr:RNA polymerase sigma factor [Ktedonobacteraceae bacterium]